MQRKRLSGKVRRKLVEAALEGNNPEAILYSGLDDAIVGIASRLVGPSLVVYDPERIKAVYRRQGMTEEEADEFFEFNVAGAHLGPHTPIMLNTVSTLRELVDVD